MTITKDEEKAIKEDNRYFIDIDNDDDVVMYIRVLFIGACLLICTVAWGWLS